MGKWKADELRAAMRLYAVTDDAWLNGRTLVECVRQAIAGGATFVQLRNKGADASHERTVELAKELAAIYSAADVFVNPTREDTYPTVNIEALACGTPVVTFDAGGSPEIPDKSCGAVVPVDDNEALLHEVIRICEDRPFKREACLARAAGLERDAQFERYLRFYE
jgi:glycosyltransferase involved in cell wall biosynthesis